MNCKYIFTRQSLKFRIHLVCVIHKIKYEERERNYVNLNLKMNIFRIFSNTRITHRKLTHAKQMETALNYLFIMWAHSILQCTKIAEVKKLHRQIVPFRYENDIIFFQYNLIWEKVLSQNLYLYECEWKMLVCPIVLSQLKTAGMRSVKYVIINDNFLKLSLIWYYSWW